MPNMKQSAFDEGVLIDKPEVVARYNKLEQLGKDFFVRLDLVRSGVVCSKDIALTREFIANAITQTCPPVLASYFEHLMIAPELAKRLSQSIDGFDTNTAEFLTWLHDIGRLVMPDQYLRNDFIAERLFKAWDIPDSIRGELLSTGVLLAKADEMELVKDNKLAVDQFFDKLTPMQRIINLADNFGKRDRKGIFHFQAYLDYLHTQNERYINEPDFSSIKWAQKRRHKSEKLQEQIIIKTLQWLRGFGVDVSGILSEMKDFCPKFAIIVRHGKLANSRDIVYNRDSEANSDEDIIHLSEEGRKQIGELAVLIKQRKFRCVRLFTSPETRTIESTDKLKEVLGIQSAEIIAGLDEVYAPGPYREGVKLSEHEKHVGDVYLNPKYKKYNHEAPDSTVARMNNVFWEKVNTIKVGETAVFVSHGYPIGWWINKQVTGKLPHPEKLEESIYLNKGEALVVIIAPDNSWFTYYLLKP